ncbi:MULTISPECIES: amidase [Gordonia]|uniref:amidase n=1 Tax=Gordonia TaxID=2053 RepID=UPI0009620B29|nr:MULTISPECIES: amidase [Gordonia]MDH3009939.1 amidase family protein [Gordonia alkanivorans]MDH3014383.1 amidase family protein [Gordonia alkanivorans]MDH3018513.1 amidase family protein [Gordonia alkanivorans]MDH3041829.1 amidase family protein [Gordonia alkanivorans]MDH3044169.1 amidase family protein [Gordonia alkanivorans]
MDESVVVSSGLTRRGFLGAAAIGATGVAAMGVGGTAAGLPGGSVRTAARRLPPPASITATDPALLSAVEAASLLQSGRLHPRELLDACLARSGALDGQIGGWVRIYPEMAYSAADAAARRLSAKGRSSHGEAPPVCGIPVALKDVFAVAGLPLTASSRVLKGNVAAGDSTVWAKLRESGIVLMGHAHTDEFAMGIATEQVGNPWDPEYSPGGSSGGSAAVLAARFVPLSTGTDTGGSLRLPASACGVTAIKPTFGRCSAYGVIPLVWTRDHVGPMGRSVADAALLLDQMVGADPNDPITGVAPPAPAEGYPLVARGGRSPLAGFRFGVARRKAESLPPALAELFDRYLDLIRRMGGRVVDVSFPTPAPSLLTGDLAEMGSYHRQFADRISSYRADNAATVAAAAAALGIPSIDYLTAARNRLRYQHEFNRMFAADDLDAVVVPGSTVDGAKRIEVAGVSVFGGNTGDVQWANLAGTPVICTPAGRSATTGLPFGVQIGGRAWDEQRLIEIVLELQAASPDWQDAPSVSAAPRDIPRARRTTPGAGPDPTNTSNVGVAFNFVPTRSTAEL